MAGITTSAPHWPPTKINNARLAEAFNKVNRAEFIDISLRPHARTNNALPIGHSQTTSQPLVIIRMLELLIRKGIPDNVLEIGAGCGYQTAILATLCRQVIAIERIKNLADSTRKRLCAMGYNNVHVIYQDGFKGYAAQAPFDAIIICAEHNAIPNQVVGQLSDDGTLVMPIIRGRHCRLVAVNAQGEITSRRDIVKFVPMVEGKL